MGYQIFLDSPIFYAGQNVTGKLLVELRRPDKMKGLYIKYFGKGKVQWSEGWGTTMVKYKKSEVYLMHYELIFGNGVDECQLPQGNHVFRFNFRLPLELPCSFVGLYGQIKYSVRAVVNKPWKKDYITKRSMTIMSIFDLNNCSIAAAPITETCSKVFWGRTNPLSMSLNIPVRGFVPGQIIPIKVSLNNESDVVVKNIEATLKQNIVFHTNLKSYPIKNLLCRNKVPVEGSNDNHNEITLSVKVPPVPPSYLQYCKIIDLVYQLNVKANVMGLHRNLKIPLEVVIGNIPLMGYEMPVVNEEDQLCSALRNIEDSSSYTPAMQLDYQPPPYTVIFPPSTTYENLAPPSYEQSVRLAENVERENLEDNQVEEFSPLYPVYKFDTSKA